MTAITGPSVTIAGRHYPVLLPRVTDPRLHVAATIITVQILGQTVLGFDVSIAQILITIGTAAVLELGIVAVTAGVIAWPASALLTGNGVALILRTPGTEHGDWWSTQGWPIFVACAGVSLLSKYAIRVGDRHLFNPSNFGLVVVFLLFGPRWADPQDLWWGPWRPALAITLAVILIGGITLSFRLKLFSVAATFWVTFAACIGVLAASGHAITARWHIGLLSGWDYWLVYVLSPEIVIFVFFMITDPRTAPLSRVARPVYAAAVGVLAGVLSGLQRTEFATKVSLLVALTVICAFRPLLERWLPDDWLVTRPVPRPRLVGAIASASVLSLAAVFLAGQISEGPSVPERAEVAAGVDGIRPAVSLPPSAVPEVVIDPALDAIAGAVSGDEAQRIGRDVVEDLAIVADARAALDADRAATAAFGPFLRQIQDDVVGAPTSGQITASEYAVSSMRVVLLQDPVSPQAIPQLGVVLQGDVTEVTYDASGTGTIVDQRAGSAERLYLVTELGGHYLIGEQLDPASPMVVGSR